MTIHEVLGARRQEILRLAAAHGARNVRVFGSVARGEADEASDVDFLVEMEPGRTLLDMGGLLTWIFTRLGSDNATLGPPAGCHSEGLGRAAFHCYQVYALKMVMDLA